MPAKRKITANKSMVTGQIALAGSSRKIPVGKNLGATNLNDIIEVSVRVRRKKAIEPYVKSVAEGKKPHLSPSDFEKEFGATKQDIELIEKFARENDLTLLQSSASRRTVILKGSVQHFSKAFSVFLSNYQHPDGHIYRGRTGDIKIPSELKDVVEGIFGLDNRPQARPMFHVANNDGHLIHPNAATVSYNANDIGKKYNFPQDVDGSGQCIALIELGGGYRSADMSNYFSKLSIPQPVIQSVSVDGGNNSPSTPDSADGEVALDIQVAGSIATGAKILVYFTPNTDKGFLDAITTALHDTANNPSVISISWGSAESNWSQQALDNFNQAFLSAAALGVTITVAAGDGGSSDGQTDGSAHVDFPASSPYALACGGTKLTASAETVWNDGNGWATGGGISSVFPVPDYQQKISLPASVNVGASPGRGLPDVAANADSNSGYNILVDGQWSVIGGTSAVAPLMAGFIALANQKLKRKAGFLQPKIYVAKPGLFKDIVKGDNATAKAGGYSAGKGWDACSGLGVPLGTLISAL